MKVDVVIPTTRPTVLDLISTLHAGSLVPDRIWVVSNEIGLQVKGVSWVRFSSTKHPIGTGDAGLRRDIGADLSEADTVVFLDDDLKAPRTMLERMVEIVERDGWAWGHHRYLDNERFGGDLLDLPPEEGRSREHYVNDWHGWQSSYAGLLGIKRDIFWEVGGFDLGFLGHHGNEDQHLGRRLSLRTDHPYRSFVHEPPFAWHPERDLFHSALQTNIMGTHLMVPKTVNGIEFSSCESCPCRRPVDPALVLMSDGVTIPYRREDFVLKEGHI